SRVTWGYYGARTVGLNSTHDPQLIYQTPSGSILRLSKKTWWTSTPPSQRVFPRYSHSVSSMARARSATVKSWALGALGVAKSLPLAPSVRNLITGWGNAILANSSGVKSRKHDAMLARYSGVITKWPSCFSMTDNSRLREIISA